VVPSNWIKCMRGHERTRDTSLRSLKQLTDCGNVDLVQRALNRRASGLLETERAVLGSPRDRAAATTVKAQPWRIAVEDNLVRLAEGPRELWHTHGRECLVDPR
jgi:hypothetical protein